MRDKATRREFVAACLAAATVPRWVWGQEVVPWLAEIQTPPETLPDDAPTLSPLLVDDAGRTIDGLEAWQKRRGELRQAWLELLGPLQIERTKPKLEVLEEDSVSDCIRQLVRYESEPDLPVEGYLLRPAHVAGKIPAVVAMHSTVPFTIRQPAGLEGDPEDFFGLKLAMRGVAAFCPRCFLWQGDGSYELQVGQFQHRHPGSLGMAKMLWDAIRAVDVLESLPYVDARRMGAVGHSLGAKEALYLAAFDERVKVTVSSEGGIGTRFSNWDAPWYLGDGIRGSDFKREHHELLALIAPRPFLLLGGDSADGAGSWPFIEAALPVYRLYGDSPTVGLFNHSQGHSVPPEAERRIYEWFATYL